MTGEKQPGPLLIFDSMWQEYEWMPPSCSHTPSLPTTALFQTTGDLTHRQGDTSTQTFSLCSGPLCHPFSEPPPQGPRKTGPGDSSGPLCREFHSSMWSRRQTGHSLQVGQIPRPTRRKIAGAKTGAGAFKIWASKLRPLSQV